MITKTKLFSLVADLVEMLIEYGAENESIIETLKYYGITEKQSKEWYGLSADDESYKDTDNE